MKLLSQNLQFFDTHEPQDLDVILDKIAPSKVLASEYGWLFLANDTNEFLSYYLGKKRWSDQDRQQARSVISRRLDYFIQRKITYLKIIIPEKSVVYSNYLPRILTGSAARDRPAFMMSDDFSECTLYMADYLTDARSFGQIYFRGDTHTTWLGAWLVYRQAINFLCESGSTELVPLPLSCLQPALAGWEGDLWTKISTAQSVVFTSQWGFAMPTYGFEVATSFVLPDKNRVAWRVTVPDEYQNWFRSRETFVYERPDGHGLKAVIFRDSTMDLCMDFFAQHFSRSVFVWYQGNVVEDVIEREKPDIVLHMMAERFVSRYPHMEALTNMSRIADSDDSAGEVL